MKVVVTGGAGFLGSHLCSILVEAGNEVVCVDNLITGSLTNIEHLKKAANFQFLQYDATDMLPDNLQAEQVYHLASPASPNIHSSKSYHSHPFETMLVNTQGTWNLIEFCLKKRAKFLFASSSEVYGDPQQHPQKESYKGNVSTIGLRSVYDEAKRFGETIVAAFVRSKNLNGRSVRIFNTFGPRMALDDGRAVIEFCVSALKNKPIQIFGSGQQTRSFCFVSDTVEGLILAMNSDQTKGQIFNLGNPEEYSIIDLANKVKEIANSNSEIKFSQKLPEDDPLRRCPDITKARTLLNWEPKVSLDEGLKRLIEYLKHLS